MVTPMTEKVAPPPQIRFLSVDFDCPDPAVLSHFYSSMLGLPVLFSSDDFILLGRGGESGLGFVRVADYRRPTWPDPTEGKQAHIELGVDDLDAAQSYVLSLGAELPSFQPDITHWRVLLDPAGHPFCLSFNG